MLGRHFYPVPKSRLRWVSGFIVLTILFKMAPGVKEEAAGL
jgi:hypothetical protein